MHHPLNPPVNLIALLLGIVLLVAGRRLYWLAIAVVGFLVGMRFADTLPAAAGSPILYYAIVLLAGILGAVLAVLLQRVAILVAGALAGGYLAVDLLSYLGRATPPPGAPVDWIPFVIGAIIGGIIAALLFDWALILLSSLVGASLIVQVAAFPRQTAALLFIVLAAVGVAVQAFQIRRDRLRPA